MAIKWRTIIWDTEIKRIESVRETEKTVWVLEPVWNFVNNKERMDEVRRDKNSTSYKFHDSWEAAHAYLLERANASVVTARNNLQQAHDTLGNVNGMRNPEGGNQDEKLDS